MSETVKYKNPTGLAKPPGAYSHVARARTSELVFVAGQPIGRPGTTNMLKLHRIGELR